MILNLLEPSEPETGLYRDCCTFAEWKAYVIVRIFPVERAQQVCIRAHQHINTGSKIRTSVYIHIHM